jgi:glutamate-1-semialdehyde 2,1-aminomutase
MGITPDMTTLGKYLAGGLTIGAFGGKRELMSVFDPDSGGTLTHGGTFNNNEISVAAGIAALTEMLTPGAIETVNNRGDRLREALNSVFNSAALPMCVTGLGSLMTVHVSGGPVHFPEDIAGSDDRLKELLFLEMLERGFYMARRGFMALSIDVTDEDLDSLIAMVSEWADRARRLSG